MVEEIGINEKDINKIEELRNQIWDLKGKLSELQSDLDEVYAKNLYNLVGKYFKKSHYNTEIIKINKVYRFDGLYKLQTIYLEYNISDFKLYDRFVYRNAYDISLGCDEKESLDKLYMNYTEISKEEFNSFLKEAFKTYSNKISNETI